LEGSLQGDLYISPGSTKWKHSLPDELITMLYEWPDVDAVERYSTFDMYLQDRPIKVRVIDGATLQPRAKFTFLKGDDGSWENLKAGEVFISESLGYRFGLTMGDYLELAAPKGRVRFRVASVIRDYSSDQGVIQMDRNTYNGVWGESGVQSAAVFMKPGASTAPLKAAIASQFTGLEKTMVSNTKMREDILVIFDKTFAPTATLKGVSLIVALLGVATALTAVLIERAREVTLMGYLGLTPGELAGMNVTQAALMGVIAFMMSVACGLLLSWIIIHAINYRSFGWSVDVHLSSTVFIRTFALTMAACVAASVYPTLGILRWVGPSSVTDE
jgi:putative ABC transport system permease protein